MSLALNATALYIILKSLGVDFDLITNHFSHNMLFVSSRQLRRVSQMLYHILKLYFNKIDIFREFYPTQDFPTIHWTSLRNDQTT